MVRKKITATTDNSKWEAPVRKKFRKPRKPMTEEQRAAASERLAKARAVRAAKNPEYGLSGIHTSLRELDEEHQLHPDKVKQWIKTQKGLLASARQEKSESKISSIRGYIRHCEDYIRHGDWIDMRYGEYQEGIVKDRCLHMAYDNDGQPKRSVGCWYPDIACEWTQEMENEKR